MYPHICHIYGPLYLNNYGLCIFIGLMIFLYLANRNWLRRTYMTRDQFVQAVLYGTLVGILGGRVLYVLTNLSEYSSYTEMLNIATAGYSVLGSIISIIIFTAIYVRYAHIPLKPLLDLVGIYAPLLMGIGRFGCFFAGCCHGARSALPWAITYTNRLSLAPLYVPLHPTQLYSAVTLIGIFFIMRFILQPKLNKPGQLFGCFLLFVSAERFWIDFLRGDQEYVLPYEEMAILTTQQWISIGIFALGVYLLVHATRTKPKELYHL